MSDREAILHGAENLIASAVKLLFPLCGEQVTIGIVQQIAAEQARLVALRDLLTAPVVSTAQH